MMIFSFTFIDYSEDFTTFYKNFQIEKERVLNSNDLFAPVNTKDCIYCSALPWVPFSAHKEPVSGLAESVPMVAYGKFVEKDSKLMMPVSVKVNHALVDGYHIGEFFKKFQIELNKIG